MKKLTQKQLKRYLRYNHKTGVFNWTRPTANRIEVGDFAGSETSEGYITITLLGIACMAHRLAWLYVYGYLPEHGLDHINNKPTDNRIENLREASKSCNAQNSKMNRRNKSGFRGVYRQAKGKKWVSQIRLNGKDHYLGCYQTRLEAALARITAEDCLPGWKCDHNSESRKKAFSMLNRG